YWIVECFLDPTFSNPGRAVIMSRNAARRLRVPPQPGDPSAKQPAPAVPRVVPPLVMCAQATFRRHLPGLLQEHHGQWVAYRGEECIAFGRSQGEVYQECARRGLCQQEFVVRRIVPDVPEEIDAQDLLDA